ncbi:hypothetical protein DM860_014615 [Cuscuta australis]|uniref:SCP domain-containing protein n=1 Tax=Cuscuta australis TaxID=267555 RepID=A0A328DH77_9ASTE|nr:hypothetical protein DM860_014615 [Cuscuta australis]
MSPMVNPPATALLLLAAFLHPFAAPTTEAFIRHAIPRDQLRRRNPVKAAEPHHRDHHPHNNQHHLLPSLHIPLPEPPFVPLYNWAQHEFVEAHNDLRATVGSPPLAWDPTLTKFAHEYAMKRKRDCDYRIHSGGPYGENLFWQLYKESSPRDVVASWFDERRFYDHQHHRCTCQPEREGCECGHYTNVIWHSTEKVGCSGYVYCDGQKGILVVCSYHPKGNILGKNPLLIPS